MRNRKFHKNGSNGIFFLALWQTQYKMRIFFCPLSELPFEEQCLFRKTLCPTDDSLFAFDIRIASLAVKLGFSSNVRRLFGRM